MQLLVGDKKIMKIKKFTISIAMDVKVDVNFTVIPSMRGMRDNLGVPEEPDLPAEIEDIEIKPLNLDLDFNKLDEDTQNNITEQIKDFLKNPY